MKDSIYILFSRNGIRSLFKKTDKMKSLPSGTYVAKLNLEVDNKFFDNRIPEFNIQLKAENIIKPKIEEEIIKDNRSFLEMSFDLFDKLGEIKNE